MIRFRLYYNKDKETKYLNEMAEKGYAMTGFCMGFYSFDTCRPGEYIYQVDITEGMFRVSNDYREFMRDMGVEIVCLWGPWVILRKRASEGPFVLYTDVESSIEHYTKIKRLFKIAIVIEICCLFMEVLAGTMGGRTATAWAFSFIFLAIIIGFVRELNRINGILEDLKARNGSSLETGLLNRRRNVSGFLIAGLLLNGIWYLIPQFEVSEQSAFMYGFMKGAWRGLTVLFLCVGLIQTFIRRR